MLSTIWLEVLQFATRADIDAIQLVSGCLNVAVANNIKSLPLRPFTLLRVVSSTQQRLGFYVEMYGSSSVLPLKFFRSISKGPIDPLRLGRHSAEACSLFLTGLHLYSYGTGPVMEGGRR